MVSDIDWFEEHVSKCKIFTTPQRSAAYFLEKLGLRFMKEYGYDNCEELATRRGWHNPYVKMFQNKALLFKRKGK